MPHRSWNNEQIEGWIWRAAYLLKWNSELAVTNMRFDASWLFIDKLCITDSVYGPNTIETSHDNVTRVIGGIQPEMLEKETQNWTFRMNFWNGTADIIYMKLSLKC